MRIAYVGNFQPEFSTENDVRKALEFLGHEVVKLQEHTLTTQELRAGALSSHLLLWTRTWDTIPIHDALDIFHECAAAGIPSATYHLDVFWELGRGGEKWWRHPMWHTGSVFTADGDHQSEFSRLGINHTWLRPGIRHDATDLGTFREEYACDVAFVGSDGHGYHEDVWTYRTELVDYIEAMCARNGWTFKNPGGRQPKIDRNTDMNDFYASAKITIGDSLCLKRRDSHYWSDRAYEAPGRGAFLIMPELSALQDDYLGYLPTYPWDDFETLEGLVDHYLFDDEGREHRRAEIHKIAQTSHTYVQRMETLLAAVKEQQR